MKALEYIDGKLILLDQTKLPDEFSYIECKDFKQVAEAIKTMKVRGAPLIGVAAAFGLAIGAGALAEDSLNDGRANITGESFDSNAKENYFNQLAEIRDALKSTRPTAVNLFSALDRMFEKAVANKDKSIAEISRTLVDEANKMEAEDFETSKMIGYFGNKLIGESWTILTHCNTGSLATCGYGTALAVIKAASESGKNIKVIADETRPCLQGSRLTALELMEAQIPVKLICDNMAGHFMKEKKIDAVIVGADRIAANGDTANKIGTYSLAVLANENGIPFYVAAPTTTIDFSIKSGKEIIIENRDSHEITHIKGLPVAPEGVEVLNPAFDVTPNRYISGIITEKSVIKAPFEENLAKLF